MSFLDILSYIGIGLGTALVLMIVSFLWTRLKRTTIYMSADARYKRSITKRGGGDWSFASFFSAFVTVIVVFLLLYHLTDYSVVKNIGLGLLAAFILWVVLFVGLAFCQFAAEKRIKKPSESRDESLTRISFRLNLILCLLNGAGFAALVCIWDWI